MAWPNRMRGRASAWRHGLQAMLWTEAMPLRHNFSPSHLYINYLNDDNDYRPYMRERNGVVDEIGESNECDGGGGGEEVLPPQTTSRRHALPVVCRSDLRSLGVLHCSYSYYSDLVCRDNHMRWSPCSLCLHTWLRHEENVFILRRRYHLVSYISITIFIKNNKIH